MAPEIDTLNWYLIPDGWNCGGREIPPEELSPSDGLSFYVSSHRGWRSRVYRRLLVSSPNSQWCPWPKSPKRPAHLRYDGTLGEDDPICWPQPYTSDAPHLPCIPISDQDSNSLVCMFRQGLHKDRVKFTDSWENGLRVFALSDQLALELNRRTEHFLKDVDRFFSTIEGPHPRLKFLANHLKVAVDKILKLQQTLPHLRLSFGITSRFFLEAHGYMKYHHLKNQPQDNLTLNSNFVGVWVEDEELCAHYQRMGVPVWYLRDRSKDIDEEAKFVKFTRPLHYRARPLWPPGAFRDDGIIRWERPVVFQQSDTGTLVKIVDSLAKSTVERNFRNTKKHSLEHREDGEILEPLGRRRINKDVEADNVQNKVLRALLEPEPSKIWADAAARYASTPLEGFQHQPRFAPPIDLITGVTTEKKAKEFVAVWKLVKQRWLWKINMDRTPPEFATRRAWKSFAIGVFSDSKMKPDDPTTTARIQFAEYMGFRKVISLPRENFHFLKDETPGTLDEKVPISMVRDTIEELADINFFYDMFEIEYHRTYDEPQEIEQRMRPAASPFSLGYAQKIPRSTLPDRAAWVVGVRDFIRGWDGRKPRDFEVELSDSPTTAQVDALERAVADVYCWNVTNVLRRRPAIPRYQ